MDLSEAIRAYQAAADYYGETQVEIAAASERFQQATTAQQTAYGVLQTAQQELLKAAREVHLPGKPGPGRPVKDNPQA